MTEERGEGFWLAFDTLNSAAAIGVFGVIESMVPGGSVIAALASGAAVSALGQSLKYYGPL
jgi:hypothetical protein